MNALYMIANSQRSTVALVTPRRGLRRARSSVSWTRSAASLVFFVNQSARARSVRPYSRTARARSGGWFDSASTACPVCSSAKACLRASSFAIIGDSLMADVYRRTDGLSITGHYAGSLLLAGRAGVAPFERGLAADPPTQPRRTSRHLPYGMKTSSVGTALTPLLGAPATPPGT
jgi:hypothetical protein